MIRIKFVVCRLSSPDFSELDIKGLPTFPRQLKVFGGNLVSGSSFPIDQLLISGNVSSG